MFVVFNCASVQIIPTTLVALRSAAGSQNIFEIIPAVWICSFATAIFAVAAVKSFGFAAGLKSKRKNKNNINHKIKG